MTPHLRCPACNQEIVGHPTHCPACDADLTSSRGLRPANTDAVPAEHLTAWWARLLDSRLITPRSSPSSENFWRFTVGAVLLFPISLLALVQGETTVSHRRVFVLLVFSVGLGVSAWIMYLRLMLRSQGLDDVSWYDMPSLTRRAGSWEQRWLAQWRLATMAKLVLRVVLLLVIAAILSGQVAHRSAAPATAEAQPTATATPNPLAGIGPIVNTATQCWVRDSGIWVGTVENPEFIKVTGALAKNECTRLVNSGGRSAITASWSPRGDVHQRCSGTWHGDVFSVYVIGSNDSVADVDCLFLTGGNGIP